MKKLSIHSNVTGTDLIPLGATLLSCLLIGLEYGMIIGIAVNLLILLYHSARPPVDMKWLVVSFASTHSFDLSDSSD